ncbi:hypothetical protein E2C01_079042 [Portunus trituberculatus]|uniref:Uncharacterized protein n=1 Tax=Portunus trituberculatus TaxID=210409 RepID=A0A5B7IP92_PORTR|nr:hypothetical protein [Portunus trituberculatus]
MLDNGVCAGKAAVACVLLVFWINACGITPMLLYLTPIGTTQGLTRTRREKKSFGKQKIGGDW